MKRIALVVEGLGDRKAFPTLVAKTAAIFDKQIYVVHLVEGGGWSALKKDRELERNCLLAASEGTPDEIIVVVDLEDDCARLEAQAIDARVKQASVETGLLIKVCFCVREYETWFLEGLSGIVENSPEIGWVTTSVTPKQCQVRGAKEAFERALGQSYRQSIDQDKFTKRLNLPSLLSSSRAYRHFAKAVVNVDYSDFPA